VTCYRLDGPGIRIPVGARFSAPVQTGPGVHPASCTMGTGSFPGVKNGRGVTPTPHPFSCRCQERAGLYPYSPYGPYDLYRASVPVQGCTSTLPILDGNGWSAPRPGRFTSVKETRYPFYRRLGGSQGRFGRVRKMSPSGFDPSTVRSVASGYTYCTIPAHTPFMYKG